MPGTYQIDGRATFAAMLLMSSGPRNEFGTDQQAVTQNGEKKWEAQIAVTFTAEPGRRAVSEVITVGLVGGADDPCGALIPGTPVEVEGFKIGVSAPEKRDNGRVTGGKAWFQATAVRSVAVPKYGKQEAA